MTKVTDLKTGQFDVALSAPVATTPSREPYISEAYLSADKSILTITIGRFFGPFDGAEFLLVHPRHDIKYAGWDGFDCLRMATGLPMAENPSEFLRASLTEQSWAAIKALETAQKDLVWGKRHAVKDTSDNRYVYVISCVDSLTPFCKIGIATVPEDRLKQLSTGCPFQLRIEAKVFSLNATATEAAAHKHFAEYRRNGEWFAIEAADAISYLNTITAPSNDNHLPATSIPKVA